MTGSWRIDQTEGDDGMDEFDGEVDETGDDELDTEGEWPSDPRDFIGWGFAVVDGKRLEFWLACDAASIVSAQGVELPPRDPAGGIDNEDFLRAWNRAELASAEALEGFAHEVAPDLRVRAPVEWNGPTTSGPGGVEGDLLQVLLGTDPIGLFADLIEIGGLAWMGLKAALALASGRVVGISDGYAVISASREIEIRYGVQATELVEVVGLHPHNLDRTGTPEGYSVTLRDESSLYQAVVSFEGVVLGLTRLSLSSLTPPGSIVSHEDTATDNG